MLCSRVAAPPAVSSAPVADSGDPTSRAHRAATRTQPSQLIRQRWLCRWQASMAGSRPRSMVHGVVAHFVNPLGRGRAEGTRANHTTNHTKYRATAHLAGLRSVHARQHRTTQPSLYTTRRWLRATHPGRGRWAQTPCVDPCSSPGWAPSVPGALLPASPWAAPSPCAAASPVGAPALADGSSSSLSDSSPI